MSQFKYVTSNRDRICKICSDKIEKNTYGIVLQDVHISPKIVDLHFHVECFYKSLDIAK